MVGDNFDSDIRPAAALGLSTAWLAPATEKPRDKNLPTVRLTTLSELMQVLQS
jgi:FMN phosphatase YigB (HAD superfamily)